MTSGSLFYGRESAAALEHVRGFQSTSAALARLDAAEAVRALQRLRDTLEDHRIPHDGIVFESRAWMITAHRR